MELEQKYSIAYKGLKNGLHEVDFDVDGALFKAYESKEIKDGRCKVHVDIDKSDTQLILDVTIDGHVVCECDRCLEDCTIPVHFDGRLTVFVSDHQGEYDGDYMWVSPDEEDINLMQYIYESIVLSLPYRRVHPDGECDPDMMVRFTPATDAAIGAAAGSLSAMEEMLSQDEALIAGAESAEDEADAFDEEYEAEEAEALEEEMEDAEELLEEEAADSDLFDAIDDDEFEAGTLRGLSAENLRKLEALKAGMTDIREGKGRRK
ncbi:MAG: DUF177 domain-containing protein [Bacteroidales bacterium]|nr:MAG: DUF177 domain-containing protein [Bacteroidales bacterium]